MKSPRLAALLLLAVGCGGGSSPPAPPAPPAVPTGLAATGETVLGEGVVHVSWTAAAHATTYRVTYDTAPLTDLSPSVATASASLDLSPLAAGQRYFVAVVASNSVGDSPRSTAVAVTPPVPPASPSGVSVSELSDADNVLDHVRVAWSASVDTPPAYLVFRSTDGGLTWSQRTSTPEVSYDDALAGDEACVRLRYRVAAAVPGASSARSLSEAVRGTVLADSADVGTFDTLEAGSPYFVVGQVSLEAATVHVSPRTVLCIGPGATLSLADGASFLSWGMLRMVGTAAQPARLTAHGAGGAAPSQGAMFGTSTHMLDETSAHFDAASGRGSVLEFAALDGLASVGFNAGTRVRESRFTATPGWRVASVDFHCPDLQRSTFDGFVLHTMASYAAEQGCAVRQNRFLNQPFAFEPAGFYGTGSPADTFAPGQFTGNEFSSAQVSLNAFRASGTLAAGGNYWGGGTPTLSLYSIPAGVTVDMTFDPLLTTPPAEAGASW